MAQGRRHPHNTHSDVASRFSTPWQPGAHLRSTAPDRVHRRLTARQPPRAHTAVRPKRCARPAKAARPCCSSSEAWPHDIDWDERTKRAPPPNPPPRATRGPSRHAPLPLGLHTSPWRRKVDAGERHAPQAAAPTRGPTSVPEAHLIARSNIGRGQTSQVPRSPRAAAAARARGGAPLALPRGHRGTGLCSAARGGAARPRAWLA